MAELEDAMVKPRLRWADHFGPFVVPKQVFELIWEQGRQIGLAQGELRGRTALAAELEQQFGIHGGIDEFSAEDAARVRYRQVH